MLAQITTDSGRYNAYAMQLIEHIFRKNSCNPSLLIGNLPILKGEGSTRYRLFFTSTFQPEFAIAEISAAEIPPPWRAKVFLFKVHNNEPFLYKTEQWNFRLKPDGKLTGNPVRTEAFAITFGTLEKLVGVTIEDFIPPNKKTRLVGEYKDFQATYSQYRRLAFLAANQFNEVHPEYHLEKGQYNSAYAALESKVQKDNADSWPLAIIAPAVIAKIKPVVAVSPAKVLQPVAAIKTESLEKPKAEKEPVREYTRLTLSILEVLKVGKVKITKGKISPSFLPYYLKMLVSLVKLAEPIRAQILLVKPQVMKLQKTPYQEPELTQAEKAVASPLGRHLLKTKIVLNGLSRPKFKPTLLLVMHYAHSLVTILTPAQPILTKVSTAEEKAVVGPLEKYLQKTAIVLKSFSRPTTKPTLGLVMHYAQALPLIFTPAKSTRVNDSVIEEKKSDNQSENYFQATEAILRTYSSPLRRESNKRNKPVAKLSLNTFNYFADSLVTALKLLEKAKPHKPHGPYKKRQEPKLQPVEITPTATLELEPVTKSKEGSYFVDVNGVQMIELHGSNSIQKVYFRKSVLLKLEDYRSSSNGSLQLTRTVSYQYFDGDLIKGFRIVEIPRLHDGIPAIIDRDVFHKRIKPIIKQVVSAVSQSSHLSDKQLCRAISQNYLALSR